MTDTQDSPVDRDEETDRRPGPDIEREHPAVTAVLAVFALASLAGVLYSLYSLTGMADGLDQTGAMLLALSLFSPIIVAVFAGAVGGWAAGRLPGPRIGLTPAGFLTVGIAAGAVAYGLFSVDASIALALAVILFGSALVGGMFSLPRSRIPVAAGLTGTLVLLLFMFIRGLLEANSISLFSDPLDQYGALGSAAPFVVGLLCGFTAFVFLRAAKTTSRLYGHLLAGALPGAIWLASTVIAQAGVEVVLALGVGNVSSLDDAYLTLMFQWQYNGAITVLFAGAVCAVLAYGLLLPKADTTSSSSEGSYQSST
ncbi:hypothetical protein GCM10027447_03380 [Glycomyces halotolerans]